MSVSLRAFDELKFPRPRCNKFWVSPDVKKSGKRKKEKRKMKIMKKKRKKRKMENRKRKTRKEKNEEKIKKKAENYEVTVS